MKILIVDDHQIIRYGLKLVLQSVYPEAIILEATALEDSINLISVNDIRLVIFNINLPGADRLESLIRFIIKESKVIIFSGYDKKHELVERLLFAGANAFIFKDFSVSDIKDLLSSIFE